MNKLYEGSITFRLTTTTLPEQIAEARSRLDRWLANITPPPKRLGQCQCLTLVKAYPLTYKLTLRHRVGDEPVTILGKSI
jgi:hypothetical protein